MEEFGDCIQSAEFSSTVQAICLLNAERLAKAYSSLQPQYNRFKEQTSPEVIHILETFRNLE
jgi:hypothetical protein